MKSNKKIYPKYPYYLLKKIVIPPDNKKEIIIDDDITTKLKEDFMADLLFYDVSPTFDFKE